jgi:hypothetical protein
MRFVVAMIDGENYETIFKTIHIFLGYSHILATKNLVFVERNLFTQTLLGTSPFTRPRCGDPTLR